MTRLIKALKEKGHFNLARRVQAKLKKLDMVPYDQKDVLVQQLRDAGISSPNTPLDAIVKDLLTTLTSRSYNKVLNYITQQYGVDSATAKQIADIVRRGSELNENF